MPPQNYGLSSITAVLQQRWFGRKIIQKGWYAAKRRNQKTSIYLAKGYEASLLFFDKYGFSIK